MEYNDPINLTDILFVRLLTQKFKYFVNARILINLIKSFLLLQKLRSDLTHVLFSIFPSDLSFEFFNFEL